MVLYEQVQRPTPETVFCLSSVRICPTVSKSITSISKRTPSIQTTQAIRIHTEKTMKLNIAIISCFIFIGIVSYHGAGARVITPYEMNVKKLTNSLFRKKNADRSLFPRFKSRRLSNSTCCVEKRWNPAEVNSVVATSV